MRCRRLHATTTDPKATPGRPPGHELTNFADATDHFRPFGTANREIQSLVLQIGLPSFARADEEGNSLNATGGAASAWRRWRRRLSFLTPSLGLARSYQRRAGSERGGDADVAHGEKSPDADEGRATDSQR